MNAQANAKIKNTPEVRLTRASDIRPELTNWLWNGWIALGKMHILGGAPGTGKTTLAMKLASSVSTGDTWPDGKRSIIGNVVIWSGEDDPADTLVPRLILAGADMKRIFFISDIRDGTRSRAFDPARDMQLLKEKLNKIGDVRLLIVDPIVSAITGDSHKNAEVRRGLQPLVDLASEFKSALVGITHFTKGTSGQDPVERLTGSLAFGALARIVLVVAKPESQGPEGASTRLLCRAKSNIGPDGDGYIYTLHECGLLDHPGIMSSVVNWSDHLIGSARSLLKKAEQLSDMPPDDEPADAVTFLLNLLQGGPKPATEIYEVSGQHGFSRRVMDRASHKLSVTKRKAGMRDGWTWSIKSKSDSESY